MRNDRNNIHSSPPARLQRKVKHLRYHIQQIEDQYARQVSTLQKEMAFLKERSDSQSIMMNDAVSYSQQLEKQIADLKARLDKLEAEADGQED